MSDQQGRDRLYTIVCHYDGAVFPSQVSAHDEQAAAASWAAAFREDRPALKGSRRLADAVLSEIAATPPTAVEGLSGVWRLASSARGRPALINIIRSA